jgi:hypothetical protein
MLIMSDAPRTMSAASDSANEREIPKTMVAIPKSATPANILRPAPRSSGWRASHTAIDSAPTAGAERSKPNPHGPVCRMSRA